MVSKIEDFMELAILSQMKFENVSEFSLIILVGIYLNIEMLHSVSIGKFLFQVALN